MCKYWINHVLLIFWIHVLLNVETGWCDSVFRVDPLALLSATLRTYEKTGCDSDNISLSCPRGTSISIEVAQYGKPGEENSDDNLCPATTDNIVLDSGIHSGTEIEIKTPESCLWPNALQYSLVQTVVEACQKKTHCKFLAQPKSFRGDYCPGVRKFVYITYKCRPYEFRSKVACENDIIQLICNPYSRIAIYSASYGRTEYESLQCAQPQGVREETCLVSYATETVMQICHGRRKCSLSADSNTFGKPCRPDSRMYLKVVYTCVPRKVLKDQYETTAPEPDEPHQVESDSNHEDIYDEDQFYRESEAIPPAPKLQGELGKVQRTSDTASVEVTSVLTPRRPHDGNSLEENQERLYLYLIIAVTVAILICLGLVILRILLQRRKVSKESKIHTSNTGETTIPNGFPDDISEIDADIDLTTPLPIPSVSRNEPTYTTYNPSISPYPNMGPSNISQHTATPMLVPASSIIGGGPPQSALRSGTVLIPSHSMSSPMGTLQMHHSINTLPHHRPPTHPAYLTGTLVSHGTLRRSHHDMDATLPRSLSRGGDNSQYFYG